MRKTVKCPKPRLRAIALPARLHIYAQSSDVIIRSAAFSIVIAIYARRLSVSAPFLWGLLYIHYMEWAVYSFYPRNLL